MSILILLLCSMLPLAVMVVAAIKGFRTGSTTVLSMLIASGLVLSASVLVALMLDDEPTPSIRFATPNGSGISVTHLPADHVYVTDRRENHPRYQ